ncbi:putative UPF0481 protein At3g02645 [Zingiber officinale]|uniref:Uncharacterized protein n=1 Tax=Zingiber officinale TaxID=94328 RepID=A0A8J5FNM3_ZINOF|nr:putative UPF0481 protein At3g02645 [Zingiber officinale]KAG6491069.1 hypothetical protein ZIOFF_052401 [Zingiber officinale]
MTKEDDSPAEAAAAASARKHLDELRWVIHVKNILQTMNEELYSRDAPSIFTVPKALSSARPDSYLPQLIAVGPYHHWDPLLYQMEHYKLAIAKRNQTQLLLQGTSFHHFVDYCANKEHAIRSFYHRHVDLDRETLAWMMAIDAAFLLEFLCSLSDARCGLAIGIKLACKSIARDTAMLENQIPLFLLRKLLRFHTHLADDNLSSLLLGFVKSISPFKATQNLAALSRPKAYAHLLQLLYRVIVPRQKETADCNSIDGSAVTIPTPEAECEIDVAESVHERAKPGPEYSGIFDTIWATASGLHVVNLLIVKPFEMLLKIPWPIFSALFKGLTSSYAPVPADTTISADEIEIPSVEELVKAGVKFSCTEGDLSTIRFDAKTATFYMPTIVMDSNTEAVVRNLVAYETTAETGPLVFARYTELMNGIIDTKEDVRLLREAGVVERRRMKSDEEVARVWNGMERSARAARAGEMDRVIAEVNAYYDSLWGVRARRFVRTYVSRSWQVLTFAAAVLLLLMTSLDAFCSVFLCASFWSN